VHAVDIRAVGVLPDGGVSVSVIAYASKQTADGGQKDIGGFYCQGQIPAAAALLTTTVSCIAE